MKKKEIVTLALTTALLMTAHAVPASAAANAPESMSQTGSIQNITPRWESTNVVVPSISISGKHISVCIHFTQKIDDLIRRYPLSGKESRKWMDTRHLMVD